MLIKVIYENGAVGSVPSSALSFLISREEIKAFIRSDGWAFIGRDPIRSMNLPFKGIGRREDDD